MKKLTNEAMTSNGKMIFLEGSNEYKVKRGGGAHREHRGPAGRRKTRDRNLLAKAAAEQVNTIVQFCSDQKGQLGTGVRINMKGMK